MSPSLTPSRRRGVELLDEPGVDPRIVRRSIADVTLANALFGGTRAVMRELVVALRGQHGSLSLLDVGTGLGDIPAHARGLAARRAIGLTTFGIDLAEPLVRASRARVGHAVQGDALALPFADGSVDIVTCSQTLHHFPDGAATTVLKELDRVARLRVIVSDLRRSWLAVAGIWTASFPLGFHPVSRHDGVVSVLRGYTPGELAATVERAVGIVPRIRRHVGFRVTGCWSPALASEVA
jgi:SAM-dependent methyltransferase